MDGVSEAQASIWSDGGVWIIVLLALSNMILAAAAFYLYRWRRILMRDGSYLVPEEMVGRVSGLTDEMKGYANILNEIAQRSAGQAHSTEGTMRQLLEAVMVFQNTLDDREQEIKRLKQGYDTELFQRFLRRFIIADQAAADYQDTRPLPDNAVQDIRELLQNALAECGVEEFEPRLHADFRKTDGLTDNPKKLTTSDPLRHFTIAEVLEPGYRIRRGDGKYNIIIPAKVAVLVPETAQ